MQRQIISTRCLQNSSRWLQARLRATHRLKSCPVNNRNCWQNPGSLEAYSFRSTTNVRQGRAQEFEGGGQFEAVRFPSKVKRRAKKGHHALRLSFLRTVAKPREGFGGYTCNPPTGRQLTSYILLFLIFILKKMHH